MLLINPQGVLHGHGDENILPTIAFVAHYDAFGIAPVSLLSFCEKNIV